MESRHGAEATTVNSPTPDIQRLPHDTAAAQLVLLMPAVSDSTELTAPTRLLKSDMIWPLLRFLGVCKELVSLPVCVQYEPHEYCVR